MRVQISWMADPPLVVPFAYHQILQGVVYHHMRNDYHHSTFIHEEGFVYGQRHFRMFTFSHLMGEEVTVKDRNLVFSGRVSFEITSPDVYMIRTIADSVQKNGILIGKQSYSKVQVRLSDFAVETSESSIVVKAISPITVYSTDADTGKTTYYHPRQEEFAMGINDNFQRKYMAYYGVAPSSYIGIEPVKVGPKDKCVTTYKNLYITGYSGIYRLDGPRKYLDFLYQSGVGAKNSQGFGMISFSK